MYHGSPFEVYITFHNSGFVQQYFKISSIADTQAHRKDLKYKWGQTRYGNFLGFKLEFSILLFVYIFINYLDRVVLSSSFQQRRWNYLLNRWFYFFLNLPKTLNLQFLQLDLEFSSTQGKSFFRYGRLHLAPKFSSFFKKTYSFPSYILFI